MMSFHIVKNSFFFLLVRHPHVGFISLPHLSERRYFSCFKLLPVSMPAKSKMQCNTRQYLDYDFLKTYRTFFAEYIFW